MPRPIILSICAGIGIVLGVFGVICQPLFTIKLIIDGGQVYTYMPGQGMQEVQMPAAARVATVVSHAITFFTSILLLAGSIGSIMLKRWARPMMLSYAGISIFNKVLWLVIYMIAMMPFLEQQAASAMGGQDSRGVFLIGVIIALLCAVPFMIAYPLFVLITYNLRIVKETFLLGYDPRKVQPAPADSGYGPQYPQQAYPPQYPGYPPYYQDDYQQGGYYADHDPWAPPNEQQGEQEDYRDHNPPPPDRPS